MHDSPPTIWVYLCECNALTPSPVQTKSTKSLKNWGESITSLSKTADRAMPMELPRLIFSMQYFPPYHCSQDTIP